MGWRLVNLFMGCSLILIYYEIGWILTWNFIFETKELMKAYTSMMKTLYTQGQEYLSRGLDKKKEPLVKIDKTATIH